MASHWLLPSPGAAVNEPVIFSFVCAAGGDATAGVDGLCQRSTLVDRGCPIDDGCRRQDDQDIRVVRQRVGVLVPYGRDWEDGDRELVGSAAACLFALSMSSF